MERVEIKFQNKCIHLLLKVILKNYQSLRIHILCPHTLIIKNCPYEQNYVHKLGTKLCDIRRMIFKMADNYSLLYF